MLSKVLQDIQLAKDGVMKVESGTAEETISKVIKTETGAHDPGLLNSSGQSADKAADIKFLAKETESMPSSLRNLTLDQIVRQTAIHLRNGQNEARIDLKPDFFGHIRMQVISKNQQVTVKILAEYGFVKDMIESNFHQLKIELRQQGLEVDRLEVMVSRDPDDSGDLKKKHTRSKAKPSTVDTRNEDLPPADQQSGSRQPLENAYHNRSVDYFA
jgi:flagellar hook-length control protein FliK